MLLVFFALDVAAEELPVSSFGQLPVVEQPTVSPDGKHIALIVNGEEGPSINVAEFGSREMTPVARLKYGSDRVDWPGDNLVIRGITINPFNRRI